MLKKRMRPRRDRGLSLVELLVVIAIIGILASMLMPALSRALEMARRAVCASNLRQLGMALHMYADESDGAFPGLQQVGPPECHAGPIPPLAPRGRAIYPEYVTDARILICPSDLRGKEEFNAGRWSATDLVDRPGSRPSIHPCRIDDLSYHYVPWVFRDQWLSDDATLDFSRDFFAGMVEALLDAGSSAPNAPDWSFIDETGQERRVLALRQGIERFLITDINTPWRGQTSGSEVPVMFDHVSTNPLHFNHPAEGANVLYLDGHVRFSKYLRTDPYPVTRAWATLVTALGAESAMTTSAEQ